MRNTKRRLFHIISISVLITAWVFSGWPQVWQNPPFPQEVQRAQAQTPKTIFLEAGATSWAVPSDWSDDNLIECVGPGGAGSGRQSASIGGTGGGGGAYAARENVSGLSGNIPVSVPAAGGQAKTIFNSGGDASQQVICDFGRTGTTSAAGAGGTAAESVGDSESVFSGGNGFQVADNTGSGGGGAAGPSGAGSNATDCRGAASDGGNVSGTAQTCSGNFSGATGNSGTQWTSTHEPDGTTPSVETKGTGPGGGGSGGTGNRPGADGGIYGGGGGGSNTHASAAGGAGTQGLIIITYTPTVVEVSISLTTDGQVEFGLLALDTTQDTTASGIDKVQTVEVTAGPADLDIRSTGFSDGGESAWSLGAANGNEQVQWEFSEDGENWSNFAEADTLYSLAALVPQNETRNIYLRLTMPTASASLQEHSATVTVVASNP